jgi:hypothetical protein
MASAAGYCAFQRVPALLFLGLLSLACGSEAPHSGSVQTNSWNLVFHDLPAALLSVTGENRSDVWAVGALLDDEALVLHYDGQDWKRVRVHAKGDLWWTQVFEDGTLFIAGDRGTIVRGDGVSFSALSTPDPSATLYGIWGTDSESLWAVGTDGTNGVVWRSNGRGGFDVADVDPVLLEQTTLFKVWGRGADDVWMVGDQGRILHFDGQGVSAMSSPTHVPLTTVHGTDSALYAVGGLGGSVILGLEGEQWVDLTPPGAPALNGVFARGDEAYVVGVFGEAFERTGSGPFQRVETGLDLARDYHSVWIDEEDAVWAVGGHVNDAPLVQGLLSYAGPHPPPNRAPAL